MLRARVVLAACVLAAVLAAPARAAAAPAYFLDFYANGQVQGSHPGGANGYLTLERAGQVLATSDPVADGNSYTKLLGQQPRTGDVVRYVIGGQVVVTHTFAGLPQISSPCAGDTVVSGAAATTPKTLFVHSLPDQGRAPASTVALTGAAFTASFQSGLPAGRVEASVFSQTADAYIWSQGVAAVRDCAPVGTLEPVVPADDEPAEAPDDAGAPAPDEPEARVSRAPNVLVVLPRGRVTVRRGSLRLVLVNTNPYEVRATAVLRLGAVRLGAATSALGAGRRAGVALRISPGGRALLARRRAVTATVSVTMRDPQDRARTRSWRLRLRAAR